MRRYLLTTAALIGLAGSAHAECRWGLVNGHQREICDHTWDFSTLPPLPSLPNLPTLRPLPPLPSLPPLGAVGQCHQAEVQFGAEPNQWLEVCPTGTDRLLLPGR